jgi:hypothetical protein
MMAPVRFSGVNIVESNLPGGYKHYSLEMSPLIPDGIHYNGRTSYSQNAHRLDLIANILGSEGLRRGEDYVSPLIALLMGHPADESSMRAFVTEKVADFFAASPFEMEKRDELLTAIQATLLGAGERRFSEENRQLFWRLLASLFVQESPMPEVDKARLLASIQAGKVTVPEIDNVTGEILWGGEIEVKEGVSSLALAGGGTVPLQCEYDRGIGRNATRDGVMLGVLA